MNDSIKLALSTLAVVLAMQSGSADAAVAAHTFRSNSVNYCQAFTPGPANTVRNRVVGAENVGATMNVACNFHSETNGGAGSAPPRFVQVYFSNNSAAAISITCTMLTGYQGQSSGYAVTKTVSVSAGSQALQSLSWSQADNPTAGATSLGNQFIGINCTLPTGAVMNDAYLTWDQDNGI